MLALKSERNERENEMQGFSTDESKFVDGGDLLDNIDFDDLFSDDVLPDLEILAELSCSESENNSVKSENVAPVSDSDVRLESPGQEIVSKTKGPEPESKPSTKTPASKETGKSGKNQPGKKKAKVDWTPELHRRFVTAVEQLGIDKAVPSRILEIMGNDRLTRHNIASHLQKYRAHQKHLQARGAEAASWSRRRQTYGTAAAGVVAAATGWIAPNPTLGFPHFRPLHVWGHPFVDQSLMYTWPKHIASPPPAPPLADLLFWHPHHQYQYIFPQPPASHVAAAQTPSNVHPSKESIDAAIEDVIRKPWLPLPLGLKPPSMDGVMVELKRRGVSKIPPPP